MSKIVVALFFLRVDELRNQNVYQWRRRKCLNVLCRSALAFISSQILSIARWRFLLCFSRFTWWSNCGHIAVLFAEALSMFVSKVKRKMKKWKYLNVYHLKFLYAMLQFVFALCGVKRISSIIGMILMLFVVLMLIIPCLFLRKFKKVTILIRSYVDRYAFPSIH